MKTLFLATVASLAPLAAFAAEPSVAVVGNVAAMQRFSFADLRALKRAHVTVSQITGHGPISLDCTGPAVSSLLDKAQPNFGGIKNAFLAHTLLFTASDNYAVALSLGEIDANYGHAAAIVATDCNGKAQDAPYLIVPGDVHAGRAVHGLVTIEVK